MSKEQLEKERDLTEKEMIKKGAEYIPNEKEGRLDGDLRLEATKEQFDNAKLEMNKELDNREHDKEKEEK